MYEHVVLQGIKEDLTGTTIIIKIPDKQLTDMIIQKHMKTAELRLDDGRTITADQRKKAYATIRDISDFTGYLPEEQKEWHK